MSLRSLFQATVRRWTPWILGAIAALYVSRVTIEFAPLSWPTPLMWLTGLALALAAFTITLVAHAFGCEVTPVAALLFYLISPTVDPHLAALTALIAVGGVLLLAVDHPALTSLIQAIPNFAVRVPASLISDAGVFLISLGVYIATLSPGLLPADSGEFQLVAPMLGIAHPPGYALYTLVGRLFTLVPVGTPAYRLNLMSAVLAAVTLTLVNRTTRQLTVSILGAGRGSIAAGLVAVVALAGATTFWAQATTANIRMPTAFFAALMLWLLVRYGAIRNDRYLLAAAFAFGLGLTHHGSLIFVAPPAVLYLLWIESGILRKGRLLMRCGVAFALALLVLLYFPVRGAAGALLDPGGLTTFEGFLKHVLARGFRGDVLAFTGRQVFLDRLRVLLNILVIQFNWPLLTLGVIGLTIVPLIHMLLVVRKLPLTLAPLLLIGGSFLLSAPIAITYRAPQTVEYLMPAYVALAILIGVTAAYVARLLPASSLQALMLSVAVALGVVNIWHIGPNYRALSQQPYTRQAVGPILRDAPPGATILSNWHWATAFWYLQEVEGLRPDVDVEYVAPAGAQPYPETWRRRLAESLDGDPVLVTNRYRTYASLPARLVPFHDAFLVTTTPVRVPAAVPHTDVSFEVQPSGGAGQRITLRGYELSTQRLQPGDDLTVRLWWGPQMDAHRDYSVFVHLVDEAGRPVGQADVRYPASRLTTGALIEGAYTLSVLPTVPPGEYRVIAGFYFTPAEGGFRRLVVAPSSGLETAGADSVQLGDVTLAPRRSPPPTQQRLEVPFAGGPTLIGVDYDTSQSEAIRVYLHWQTTASDGPWTATLTMDDQTVARTQVAAAPAGAFLTTALDVPPSASQVRLELSAGTEKRLLPKGVWHLPILGSSVRLPRIQPGTRYLVFGGEMALADAQWKAGGREVVIDLEWMALKPLVRDYTVSVQLFGASGWRAQHDGTPALGAIPTLKWVRGMEVVDRHRVMLPEGAEGPADIQVSVYDAFTQTRLGVLDDRFQRAGQGQAAVIGRLELPPAGLR